MFSASTLTGRYLLLHKFPICSAKYSLQTVLEDLALKYNEHDGVNCTEWHKLFRLFSKVKSLVKSLHIAQGLIEELSCCLQSDNREPSGLLPDLQEIAYI